MTDKPLSTDQLKQRLRDKTIDERAMEAKRQISEHLEAVAAIMNEVAKDQVAVAFNIARNEHGVFTVQGLTMTRTF